MYIYQYPRPMVTVDLVLLNRHPQGIQVLLVQRKQDPFQGAYALPGGFMEMGETLEEAATRELQEETGLQDISLEQIHTFSQLGRDPRGRVISTAFGAVLNEEEPRRLKAGSDAAAAAWFSTSTLPELAFDHQDIIRFSLHWYQLRD